MTMSFGEKEHLAGSVMGMEADRSTGVQSCFHNAVETIEKHVSVEFLFASLEMFEGLFLYSIEINYHNQKKIAI